MGATIALLIAAVSVVICGCGGTLHHVVPARPLQRGETVATLQFSTTFNRLAPFGAQIGLMQGLTENDILSVGFDMPLLFPTALSYAHYQEVGSDRFFTYRLHTGNIAGFAPFTAVPGLTVAVGIGGGGNDIAGGIAIGLSHMGTALSRHGGSLLDGFLPYASASLRLAPLAVTTTLQPGLTKRIVRHVRGAPRPLPDTLLSFSAARISAIDSSLESADGRFQETWRVALGGDTALWITTHSYYLREWFFLNLASPGAFERNRYPLSATILNYNVFYGNREWMVYTVGEPRYLLELDMREVLRRYRETGVLVLEDFDSTGRMAPDVPSMTSDLSIGLTGMVVMKRKE